MDNGHAARRAWIWRHHRVLLGILYPISDTNDVLCFHDETIADLIESLEHHERTGALIRQLHVLRSQARHSAQIALVHRVAHRAAHLEYSEYVAGREPVASASVDDHDLILSDYR